MKLLDNIKRILLIIRAQRHAISTWRTKMLTVLRRYPCIMVRNAASDGFRSSAGATLASDYVHERIEHGSTNLNI